MKSKKMISIIVMVFEIIAICFNNHIIANPDLFYRFFHLSSLIDIMRSEYFHFFYSIFPILLFLFVVTLAKKIYCGSDKGLKDKLFIIKNITMLLLYLFSLHEVFKSFISLALEEQAHIL